MTVARVNRTKLLFIAGFGRNGGTILDQVLGEIDGFAPLGELRFVWLKGLIRNELCGCGQHFRECPFWREVFDRGFGGFDAVDAADIVRLYRKTDASRYFPLLLAGIAPPGLAGRANRYVELLGRLHISIAETAGADVLVNSSKFPGYGLLLDRLDGFELYVLHLVRDSRATALSWQSRKRKVEVVGEDAYVKRYGSISTALQWSYRNAFSDLLARGGRNYRRLRYEDFASDPEATVAGLVDWLGLEPRRLPFISPDTATIHPRHTQSGNPRRFDTGTVAIRLDDRWPTELSPTARRAVTCLTAPLLMHYGYPLSRPAASDRGHG